MKTVRVLQLLLCALLVSCGNSKNSLRDGVKIFDKPLYEPKYASGFTIEGGDGSRNAVITISNPWQGDEGTELKLLINRDGSDVPADFYGQILNGDAKRIVTMSSTHVAMLDAIGAVDRIVGVSGIKFITNRYIQAGRDTIGDVGYDNNINYEKLVALEPDIVVLYGVNGASPLEGKLKELKIPYIYIGDYLEESPLGKAEWMVVLSELVGKREDGEKIYTEIPLRYNALKQKVAENVLDAPTVMLNIPYGDTWFMPSVTNYAAQLVADAGGHYIYEKNTGNTSRPIDLEEAYDMTSRADMWLNVGQVHSLDELKAACPRFVDTRCFHNGDVYNNNLRVTPGGGNDYYEWGVVRPDLLLRDHVKMFHPELVEEDFVFYKRLH